MLAEFIQLPKDGDNLGPFFLRKTLSTSILGSFYIATHKGLHEDCLIHIVPEALLRADSRFLSRYKQSIERQGRLTDQALLKPVEATKVGGNLVVRYKGSNFRSMTEVVANRKDPFPSDTVRQFLRTIAGGLSDAAKIEQGHYFMTPDFLFLNDEGEVRVAGLGLFQSVHYESFERFVSAAVIPIQTDRKRVFTAIEILSPEIRNFKSRDHRSDFYCLGMCAYFLLTGQKPERKWNLPTQVRKDIDSGWNLFISHCLEAKPSDRFPHYRSFIRDLDNLEDLSSAPKREEGQILRTLNRIPLPKALAKMVGMRSPLLIRLVLLGIAGVLAVGTASLFYQILFSDYGEVETRKPIKQVMGIEEANLSLNVTPINSVIRIYGPETGKFFARDRDLHLRGRSGEYTIQISAPRREKKTIKVSVTSSQPQYLEVDLDYAFTGLQVEAAVGTQIYTEIGEGFPVFLGAVTEKGGVLIDDRLLVGEYVLLARHPAFLPAEYGPVKLTSGTTVVEFEQLAKPTELIVTSDPEGAVVFIDDTRVGLTPLRVEGLEADDPLNVTIKKEGYRTVERELEFSKGQSQSIETGPLELKIGVVEYTLQLPMKNPPLLEAFLFTINDEFYRLKKDATIRLPEGRHIFKLQHPDFFTYQLELEVEDRDDRQIIIAPDPKPMRVNPIIPEDYVVRFNVDGEVIELNESGFLELPSYSAVEVEAVVRGFHDVIQTFEGAANEIVDWEVPMKPLPGAELGKDYNPPYFDLRLVWLEPDLYQMGSPVTEFRRLPNEDNLTTVRFTYGFWISTTEITQKTFLRIMGSNPSQFEGENHPVDSVTWPTAMLFCQRLTEFEQQGGRLPEGYIYRLPTEAEWEYAARGGTTTPFVFGTVVDPSYGNFQGYYAPGETVGRSSEDRYGTLEVGSFDPNAYGLYDVHGNVAEWTLDRFWDRHPGGMAINPHNTERGRGFPLRGGSWRDSADRVRTAAREGASGATSSNSIGFRIVLAPDPESFSQD